MTRKRRIQDDPLEQEIELALEPGTFVRDRSSVSFVRHLDAVATKIAELADSDPACAVTLYETFLAACYLKSEELDDSSGNFGRFVKRLYCGWIRARQADEADPEETASRLLTWIDEDDCGFCYGFETEAVRVFDTANLGAFARLVRARFDAAAQKSVKKKDEGEEDGPWERPDYLRDYWGGVLRTPYAARGEVAAYVALAEETGLTAKDCHAIATLLVSKHKPEEALSWVERGSEIDRRTPHGSRAGYDLASLERDLLVQLGRSDEALDAAWAEYLEHSSTYTYDDLMKYVPEARRKLWHEKAIEAATGADLRSVMNLLLETRELGRLAELVRQTGDEELERLSHYTTEPVAKKLESPHPELAARLWQAQGLRILNAKKSKYYDAALSNFERAKHCFERAGLEGEWSKSVRRVRADHHLKSSFMPRFERLVEGLGPGDEPSFLDRAKARWAAQERRTR